MRFFLSGACHGRHDGFVHRVENMIRAVIVFAIIALIVGAVWSFLSKLDIDQQEIVLKIVSRISMVVLVAAVISLFLGAVF